MIALGFTFGVGGSAVTGQPSSSGNTPARLVETVPGMPPVTDASNLYSEARADKLSATAAGAAARVYVPNLQSNDVHVIDQATLEVVDRFGVGVNPQHAVPSWDFKTLWVTHKAQHRTDGTHSVLR